MLCYFTIVYIFLKKLKICDKKYLEANLLALCALQDLGCLLSPTHTSKKERLPTPSLIRQYKYLRSKFYGLKSFLIFNFISFATIYIT